MDTRFWGPSGWQLFHWVAFRAKEPQEFLKGMAEILPCKFCRASTTEYVKEHPLKGDPGKWVYDIHNMVNNKLRTQCKDDPKVINPGPDPSFEEVKKKYEHMDLKGVLGRDFLFSIAVNYPDDPTDGDKALQRRFLDHLAKVYPGASGTIQADLTSRKTYMKSMYAFLKSVGGKKMPVYRGYVHRVMYYKSGCAKKTYKGKTCRRSSGGGLTKERDNKRTRRITGGALL
jgi:Erv1 / Alr family